MTEPRLRVGHRAGWVVIRLEGELRHPLGEALERCITEQLTPDLEQLVLDLEAATFVDSTLIGLLVLAARRAALLGTPQPWLICPSGDLWQQFVALNLDGLFRRIGPVQAALPALSAVEAAPVTDAAAQAALVLRAHRALVQHDPRNAETFAGLIALLEDEVSRPDPER